MATKKKTRDTYMGPMYSDQSGYMDSTNNMGSVDGPKGGETTPDRIGFEVESNRKAGGRQK